MLVRARNRAEVGWQQPQTFIYDPETGQYYSETGWFGSKLIKKVGKAVGSVAKAVTKLPGVSTAFAPLRLVSDIAHGKNVAQSFVRQGKSVVADTRAALPVAASIVSVVPGAGTALGAGLSAASALSQGKSLAQIGQAAALGAIPGGQLARSAVRAGIGIARGQNVAKTLGREGIAYARQNLPGGELAQRGLNVALNVAQGRNVVRSIGREGIAYARSQVPVPSVPQNLRNVASTVTSRFPGVPMQISRLNLSRPPYGIPGSISPENVRRGVRQGLVGLTRPSVSGRVMPGFQRAASFRPLAKNTRNWLVRGLPHMRSEVSGLSETGAQWIVESGDTGSKIALKLTGNANRWTELRSVNPKIMGRGADLVKKYGFPIYVGDLVNLPATWIKSTAQTPAASAPATPSAATPPPVSMPGGDLAAQGQARTILAAWGKTDGSTEAGVPDYGSQAELMATSWTARDVLQGDSFANWWRRNGGPPSVDNGQWSDSLATALNNWAQQKANQVTNTAIASGGVVIPPVATTTPAPTQLTVPTVVSTPGQIPNVLPQVLPQVVPSTISVPTVAPTTVASDATSAPQQQTGLTESQKWGLGSMAAGTTISILVRLIA